MRFLQPIFFTIPVGLMIFVILLVLGRLVFMVDFVFLRAFYVFFAMIVSIAFINTFFLQVINFYFDLVIITDCRILIIRKTVFLKNNSDAIDLTKIQDIAVESHGLLQNYLKYGKLVITLSTSAPPVITSFVPDPHYYLEWTNRIKREHIIQRQEKKKTPVDDTQFTRQVDYLQDIHNLNTPV